MEQRAWYWQWSMPVGNFVISLPKQPLSTEDVDDLERITAMAIRLLRRVENRKATAEPDYAI